MIEVGFVLIFCPGLCVHLELGTRVLLTFVSRILVDNAVDNHLVSDKVIAQWGTSCIVISCIQSWVRGSALFVRRLGAVSLLLVFILWMCIIGDRTVSSLWPIITLALEWVQSSETLPKSG